MAHGDKPQHSVVIEAMTPSQITSASISNKYVVCHHLHTCCRCAFGCFITMLPLILLSIRLLIILRGKPQHSALVETMDPFKMASTSMSNTWVILLPSSMLLLCMWMRP